MKKTLIALAVAASAAISGSAMAWTPSGSGGSVELSGMLIPVIKVNPWEVKVGDAVKALDAKIEKDQRTVEISLKSAIPLLGIRTKTSDPFKGQKGISPQISYGNAIDTSSFKSGEAPLTLELKDSEGAKIGKAESSVMAVAMTSVASSVIGNIHSIYNLYAKDRGDAFFGGLSTSPDGVHPSPLDVSEKVFAGVSEHYNSQKVTDPAKKMSENFMISGFTYSSFYASGIPQSSKIKIILDKGVGGSAPIQWKASLPITVSYM